MEICLSLWSQLTSHLGKTLLLSSLLYLLTGFSSSRAVGFSSLLVVGQRLPSVPCSWALPACFIRAREHKMPERGGTSQIEVTVFCNLVMERVPHHFTILYLLEASHWIRATLGKGMILGHIQWEAGIIGSHVRNCLPLSDVKPLRIQVLSVTAAGISLSNRGESSS